MNIVRAVTRRRLPAGGAGLSLRRRLAGALTGLVVLPLLTVVLTRLRDLVNLPSQTLLYLLSVVVVALVGGLVPALAAAVVAAVLLDHYFIPPLYDFAVADPDNVVALLAFLLVAGTASSVVGLAARRREAEALATANARSSEEFRRLAQEQVALRRVATLVARGLPAAEVFEAVAREAGRVLGAHSTNIVRFDPDDEATVVASVGQRPDQVPVGTHWKPEPPLATAAVQRTGRPARSDDYGETSGMAGDAVRRLGIRSGVAAPILVEGQLWGAINIGTQGEHFPADAEHRLVGFTELVATAVANAEGRARLQESRDELRRLADEQAALRRVATLVARGVPRVEVFPAVAQEVRHLLGAAASMIARVDPDGAIAVVDRVGEGQAGLAVASRWRPEPPLALAEVLRTGRPARCDDYDEASGAFVDDTVHRMGIRSSVAVPIVVEGRLWGVIVAGVRHGRFPADAEDRMAGFTELVGTAIANAEGRAQLEVSRNELRRLADEQAALRRVATLVARGVPAAEVFEAVAHEVAHVVGADGAGISRLDPDGAITVCAVIGSLADMLSVGSQWRPEPPLALAVVLRTGRPARNEDYRKNAGLPPLGIRSGVAVPIVVEGRLWGAISVTSRSEPLPADTEQRMAAFTELAGTAIANADSRAQLTASRTRIVAAADDARRRIERDLHDGTQQRLVALSLTLRLAQATVPPGLTELQDQIGRVADELTDAIEELREIARGIHPAILSEGGLGPALRTLARRAAIPVELDIRVQTRAADPIEVAAYYVVSEALTNATKHAGASCAQVAVGQRDALLDLSIRDDGVGGADPTRGSGLVGLRDRVQALGGSIEVDSPPGAGTAILVELPLRPD